MVFLGFHDVDVLLLVTHSFTPNTSFILRPDDDVKLNFLLALCAAHYCYHIIQYFGTQVLNGKTLCTQPDQQLLSLMKAVVEVDKKGNVAEKGMTETPCITITFADLA